MATERLMRIGELSRRTGMAEATLRAWERRYGLPRPARTVGGHRLYSETDVARVLRAMRLVDQGWAVNAAAKRVARQSAIGIAEPASDAGRPHADALIEALRRLDLGAAGLAFDAAQSELATATLVDDVVEPTMASAVGSTGDAPEGLDALVASFLAHRLAVLLDEMEGGRRAVAVTGAPSGDTDPLAALMASVALAGAGWTVRHLGADIPNSLFAAAAHALGADVVVVATGRSAAARAFVGGAVPAGPVVYAGRGFGADDAQPDHPTAVVGVRVGGIADAAEALLPTGTAR